MTRSEYATVNFTFDIRSSEELSIGPPLYDGSQSVVYDPHHSVEIVAARLINDPKEGGEVMVAKR